MTEQMKESLDYIINKKEIKTVFQPIISLRDGSILGHEALSRITCASSIENPEMLFTAAEDCNRLWDLELLCRTKALEAAFVFMVPPYNKKLFINVNPNIMHDEKFKRGFTKNFLEQYEITPENVIFEITERHVITDIEGFTDAIEHYKSQDYEIAIDDAGAGYSGLNLISDVNPHYIKLDMKLIRNINNDKLKFALVKGMVEFSKVSNIFLIAEGIETYGELETLVKIGVQYGQGYFIQEPDAEVLEIKEKILQILKKINYKKNNAYINNISNIYIKNLCTPTRIVSPNESVTNVYNIFKQNPDSFGVCVIEKEIPVGVVTQEKLALKLSGHYGFSLNQKKSISEIMDREFLSVDYNFPVNTVANMAMARPNSKLYDFIVVTEDDRYIGTVTIKDLLQKTMEIEISAAKHQNPLSELPGNLLIEQKLSCCLLSENAFSVAYIDIDNFKAYNDVYGFEKGDLVIKLLADILKKHFSNNQFIGHVGGDDFVVIFDEHVTAVHLYNMVNQFELEVLTFYNKKDIQNGYITSLNRHGEVENTPLITLTCVVENNENKTFENVFELTETLAELKKLAKHK
nr:GGDEF domain-containing protein [Sedimentibacter sp.]